MCKCTPEIRTPYCGRGNCINPHDKPQGARSQLPQDVEEFIEQQPGGIDDDDPRAWMSGYVMVPVIEPRLMSALRRFKETTEDDSSYDIDSHTMQELAGACVVRRRGTTSWYDLTALGSAMLNSSKGE